MKHCEGVLRIWNSNHASMFRNFQILNYQFYLFVCRLQIQSKISEPFLFDVAWHL